LILATEPYRRNPGDRPRENRRSRTASIAVIAAPHARGASWRSASPEIAQYDLDLRDVIGMIADPLRINANNIMW